MTEANTPLIMGHRGFKEDPEHILENTQLAFDTALHCKKVDIIETDIQMTLDGELVINHDTTTKRIYDRESVVLETTLEELMTLKNLKNNDKMITVDSFVKWMVETKGNDIKVIFDCKPYLDPIVFIKLHNILLKYAPSSSSSSSSNKWWKDRVFLGIWSLDHLKFGYMYSPMFYEYNIVNISLSLKNSCMLIDWLESNGFPSLYAISIIYVALWDDSEWCNRVIQDRIVSNNNTNTNNTKDQDIKLCVWTMNDLGMWKYTVENSMLKNWNIWAICTDKPTIMKRRAVIGKEGLNSLQLPPFWKITLYKKMYSIVLFMLFNKWCQMSIVPFKHISIQSIFISLLKLIHFI